MSDVNPIVECNAFCWAFLGLYYSWHLTWPLLLIVFLLGLRLRRKMIGKVIVGSVFLVFSAFVFALVKLEFS